MLAGSHVDPKLAALLLECPPALCSHDGGHACFNHARLDHNLGNPSSNSCSRAGCATSSHDTCHVHRAGSAGRTAHVSGDRPVVLLGSIPQKLLRAAAASCGALPAPDLAAAAAAAAAASADAAPAGPGFAGAAPLSSAAPRAAAGAKAAAQASGAAGARGGAAAAAAAAASAHAPEVGAPGGSCPCRPACVAHGVHVWLLREGGHLLDERGGCSSLGGRTARREDALPAAHPPATPLLVLEPAPTSMPQLPAAPPPAQTWAPSTHELRPVSILLHAPTCAALSSSATAVSSCLARLRSALAAGRVLPGGGVFELLCAARLRAAAAQEEGAAAAEGVGAEACGALQAVASEVGGTSMHGAPKPGLEAGANSGAPVQRVMAAAAAAATSPAVAPQGAAPGCSITKAEATPAAVGTGTGRAQESTVAAPLKCTGRVPRWQRLNSMLAQVRGLYFVLPGWGWVAPQANQGVGYACILATFIAVGLQVLGPAPGRSAGLAHDTALQTSSKQLHRALMYMLAHAGGVTIPGQSRGCVTPWPSCHAAYVCGYSDPCAISHDQACHEKVYKVD